jgi:hypothetical protein
MSKIEIEIPCDTCGCSTYDAMTTDGKKCKLQVCKCEDGSGDYEVTINELNGEVLHETHRCDKKDITDCLNGRFSINADSITHECG